MKYDARVVALELIRPGQEWCGMMGTPYVCKYVEIGDDSPGGPMVMKLAVFKSGRSETRDLVLDEPEKFAEFIVNFAPVSDPSGDAAATAALWSRVAISIRDDRNRVRRYVPPIMGGQGRTAEDIERDGAPSPETVSIAWQILRPSNLIPFVIGFACGVLSRW